MVASAKAGFVLGLIIACAALSQGAWAAGPTAKQRAVVLQAVVDCRKVADAAARVACYDAAVDRLDRAEASGDVVVVDREEARKVRRETFGLQLPSLDVFGRALGDEAETADADRIVEAVKSASRLAYGQWMLELQSGAVWRQIDDRTLNRAPHPGSTAEIRKGAFGGFFMKVDGQPAIKVRRDR